MAEGKKLDKKIEAIAWSLFLLWVGAAWLLNLGANIGSIGVGIIILGAQAVRKYFKVKIETFWLVIGVLFVISGLGIFSGINIPLIPLVFIAIGTKFLHSAITGKK